MIAKALNFVAALNPLRWTGPVYLKELLCASRRKRSYLLRVGYVAALGLFVTAVYLSQERSLNAGGNSGGGQTIIDRMADIGKHVIYSIAWFQFIAAQLVAILLMCNAVAGEVQKRTFPALLTTPITFFQISFGKILGGMQQVILLLLISLPLLALVRVLGGVPWQYVVGTSILTIGAAIFTAAITFNFSIIFRQPYAVLVMSLLVVALWHGLAWILWPILVARAVVRLIDSRMKQASRASVGWRTGRVVVQVGFILVAYVMWVAVQSELPAMAFNPSLVMYALSENLLVPGRMPVDEWAIALNFVVTSGAGLYFLWRGAGLLRGIAHTKAWGDALTNDSPMDPWAATAALNRMADGSKPEPVHEITDIVGMPVPAEPGTGLYGRVERFGSPVAWKDLHGSLIRNDLVRFFAVFLPLGLVCVMYFGMLISESFVWISTHAYILAACIFVGTLFTAVLAGMSIATERQARTWPLLQTTTLSGGRIFYGKSIAILFRVAPVWIILFAHLSVFTLLGQIHVAAFVAVLAVVVWVNVFLIGSGSLISTFTRQATLAAGLNVAVATLLWLLLPSLSGLLLLDEKPLNYTKTQLISPVQQTFESVRCLPGPFSRDKGQGLFNETLRSQSGIDSWDEMTVVSGLSLLVYGGAGLCMAGWAMRRFRRHAF